MQRGKCEFVSLFILVLLSSAFSCTGVSLPRVYLSSLSPDWPLSMKKILEEHARRILTRVFGLPRSHHHQKVMPLSFQSTIAPAASLPYAAMVAPLRRHHSPTQYNHHPHHHHPKANPNPSTRQGCAVICADPFTRTPLNSTCGCVIPIKVSLLLDMPSFVVFPAISELEMEVAVGTYLKHSQVRIMGISADSQNQERTTVNIYLVPLGEKFDNSTAELIYGRFWRKKVPINMSLFGSYKVLNISYPGIPHKADMGSTPGPSSGYFPDSAIIDKKSKTSGRTMAIIVLSTLLVISVATGALVYLKLRSSRESKNADDPTFSSSTDDKADIESLLSSRMRNSTSLLPVSEVSSSIPSLRAFTLSELKKATEKFSSRRILEKGGSGCVYRATLEDGAEVAVKLLTKGKNDMTERDFIAGAETLSRLNHCNVVKLIGTCIHRHARCLVFELFPNGSVESHLYGANKEEGFLSWDLRVKIALGAAKGLAYLHEDSIPPVVHGNFKSSNILLDEDFTTKVADMELAKEATQGNHPTSSRVIGTFGYIDPQYAMTGHLLTKTDVYSYGVVLLELLSGRKAVDMSQPVEKQNLVTWAKPLLTSKEGLRQLVDPSLAGNYKFEDIAKMAAIAAKCIHPVVDKRPFMGEVVQALKLICNDIDNIYEDSSGQRDPSSHFSDVKWGFSSVDSGWWDYDVDAPQLPTPAFSFSTMEYRSWPLEGRGKASNANATFPQTSHAYRQGSLRRVRSYSAIYSLRSMSDILRPF